MNIASPTSSPGPMSLPAGGFPSAGAGAPGITGAGAGVGAIGAGRGASAGAQAQPSTSGLQAQRETTAGMRPFGQAETAPGQLGPSRDAGLQGGAGGAQSMDPQKRHEATMKFIDGSKGP